MKPRTNIPAQFDALPADMPYIRSLRPLFELLDRAGIPMHVTVYPTGLWTRILLNFAFSERHAIICVYEEGSLKYEEPPHEQTPRLYKIFEDEPFTAETIKATLPNSLLARALFNYKLNLLHDILFDSTN